MDYKKHIIAFSKLGNILKSIENNSLSNDYSTSISKHFASLKSLINNMEQYNGWFTKENVKKAVISISLMLEKHKLEKWFSNYTIKPSGSPKNIGVIMAGNLPLVGFHDFLCVICSGNKITAKLSSEDNKLLPLIAEILLEIEPNYKDRIIFTKDKIKNADAYIATGSNNTARYFEYYFGKHKSIIRKNRNSIAVLTGSETKADLKNLAKDIFQYFGLGCRNVTKIFIPEGYDFSELFETFEDYKSIINHNKYANNYEYYRSIYLVNQDPHLDNGFIILKHSSNLSSPVATLYYSYYKELDDVVEFIELNRNSLQCIVSGNEKITNSVKFGQSQEPELWDYADGIDTMKFLLELN